MQTHQAAHSRQALLAAPFWRLAVVVLCLSAAIYIPLLASEPRRVIDQADIGSTGIVPALPSLDRNAASTMAWTKHVRDYSAMAQLPE